MSVEIPAQLDAKTFRDVLGCCPTGVALITGLVDDTPLGMVVGTFTSISLDPPLVGFFPGRQSKTWSSIAPSGRFCVNILSCDQAELSRSFAAASKDRFRQVIRGSSPAGLPLIEGVSAWVDCTIAGTHEIGDHYLVVGAVEAMGRSDALPLVFLRGGYHSTNRL